MMDAIRTWLILTALAGLGLSCAVPACRADTPSAPSQPTVPQAAPGPASTAELLPPPASVQDRPPPFVLPPPPDYSVNGQGWIGSPLLDRPEAAQPGFFVNGESSLVFPHFQNQLQGGQITLAQTSGVSPSSSVGLPPGAGMPITGDIVSLPSNHFNPTISPRLELGYRLPDGWGEIRLGYRFMDTTDSGAVFLPGLGPANQNGRLDVQFVDLDYGTQQFSLGPDWEMRTAIGLRYSEVFFDSQVAFVNPTASVGAFGTVPFTRLTESETMGNWYIGAHAIMEVGRKLLGSGPEPVWQSGRDRHVWARPSDLQGNVSGSTRHHADRRHQWRGLPDGGRTSGPELGHTELESQPGHGWLPIRDMVAIRPRRQRPVVWHPR